MTFPKEARGGGAGGGGGAGAGATPQFVKITKWRAGVRKPSGLNRRFFCDEWKRANQVTHHHFALLLCDIALLRNSEKPIIITPIHDSFPLAKNALHSSGIYKFL